MCCYPITDDVEEYIKEFPLHVPLRNTLFSPSGTASHNTTPSNIDDINNATYRTQPVVRMGHTRKRSNEAILRTDNDRDEARLPDCKYTIHVIFYIILTLCYQQLCIKKENLVISKKSHVTEEEVLTDSAKSDNGWIVCKTSSKHRLLRLGDPNLCVGATFTISRKYSHKFLFGDEFELSKIHSVVRRHGSSAPFFKFYNMLDFPDHLPRL